MADLLVRLKARLNLTGNDKDALLAELLDAAKDTVKAYTGRESAPQGTETAAVCLAVIQYNRLGMEGEASHTEGSVSVTVDAMPADIKAMLRPYRLAGTV